MSLDFETAPTEQLLPPPATAGRMYRQYVLEDLPYHESPSAGVTGNPFFQASMQLARLWQQAPKYGNTEQDSAAQADFMALAYDNLPDARDYDCYLTDVLRTGHILVDERDEAPNPELQVEIQDLAIDRALSLRGVLCSPLSEKAARYIQQKFAAACVLSVLNVENLVMPPAAHQIIDNHSNIQDGVLLERNYRLLGSFRRFSVVSHCTGFAEGHPTDAQASTLALRFKRVRVLSACCDLKLLSEDGRTEMNDILDILQDYRQGTASSGDTAYISQISRNLADTIISGESRKGTRLTRRQSRKEHYKVPSA